MTDKEFIDEATRQYKLWLNGWQSEYISISNIGNLVKRLENTKEVSSFKMCDMSGNVIIKADKAFVDCR